VRILLVSVAAAAVLAFVPSAQAQVDSPAHIDNGTVELGVVPEGRLNAYDVDEFGDYFGLRYLPTGNESIALIGCEGWGVADPDTGSTGFTNLCDAEPTVNVEVESFTTTATTAVSTVLVRDGNGDPLLRVTHDYHPSTDSEDLYEVTVTIENVSANSVAPRYRRLVNWALEPDFFEDVVTIAGTPSPILLGTSNDGYGSADPLSPPSCAGSPCVFPFMTGFFTDAGPADQGSLFDLSLPSLAPDESLQFNLFYGASATEEDAATALAAVGADVWTLAQDPADPDFGTPNTFILAFRLADLLPSDGVAPTTTASPSPAANSFGWNKTPVQVTLNATDDTGGSGVARTYYSVDDPSCDPGALSNCLNYAGPFTVSGDGTHTVRFFSEDNAGNVEALNTLPIKIDTTAPGVSCSATPGSLWPPNHKLVAIATTVRVNDGLSGPNGFKLLSATSNEPGQGDDVQGWAIGTADTAGLLRAERLGSGTGRVYTLRYLSTDAAGNGATCDALVRVAHDQGKGKH
jgi:hypothetical protein